MLKERNKQLNLDMIAKSPSINSDTKLGLESINIVSMLDTKETKQESKTKIEIKRWRHKLNKILGQSSTLKKVSMSVAEWYIKKNQAIGNIWTIRRQKELESVYKLIIWIVLTREEKLLESIKRKNEWKLGVGKELGESFILMNDWLMLEIIEKYWGGSDLESKEKENILKEFREMKQLGVGFNMSIKLSTPPFMSEEEGRKILKSYFWIP